MYVRMSDALFGCTQNNLRGILYPYILTIFSNHLLPRSSRYVLSGNIPICLKIFLFHLLDPVLRTYVRRSIGRSRRTITRRNKQHQHPPHETMLPISYAEWQNLSNKAPMSFIPFLLIRSSITIDDFKKNEAHLSFIGCLRRQHIQTSYQTTLTI